jgi:hypothetical protein
MYYWIKYDKFIEDLPILNMKKTRLMEIFNNNLCEKPLDWESRYNSMSESSKKRAKSFKFTGVLKSFTKKDKTGTYSYFTFTKKFYDMLPSITNNDDENKKASSTAIDEAPQTSTSINNLSNNSIPQKDKKDSKKIKKDSEILQVIKDSCVNIKKQDLNECEELFTDINRLKLALEICENNNNNGIKALKLAYKKAYTQNNNSNDDFTNNFSKGAGSGVNNNFAKYGNDLEVMLQKSQEGKFKDIEQGISQFNPSFKL